MPKKGKSLENFATGNTFRAAERVLQEPGTHRLLEFCNGSSEPVSLQLSSSPRRKHACQPSGHIFTAHLFGNASVFIYFVVWEKPR